ncbi:MAG TPA: hypothetical protein VHF25_04415 [Nitriliruptorales bacterium]|nr:hypothetical protein [Nitriliruptorales bacterium]
MLPRAWLIEVYENLRTEAGLGRPAGDRPTVHPRGGSDQRRDLPWIDAAGAVDGRQVRPADGDGHGTNGESEHETGAAPWRMQD